MKFTPPFKTATPKNITQGYHANHPALDMNSRKVPHKLGYGTPLVAPEDCYVVQLKGDTYTPGDNANLARGYGIWLKGKETGHTHFFWHTLPIFPVSPLDTVTRGKIVAYMGNAGTVRVGGVYVPLEERTDTKRGTHLHWEVFAPSWRVGKPKQFVDPTPLIDWSLQPTYTAADELKAALVAMAKLTKLISK